MKPELFREICMNICNHYDLLVFSTAEKYNSVKHLNNLISEFDKIIGTNGIIESNVYDEIVLFTRIYYAVCNIQRWMKAYCDLKLEIITDLNRFPAKYINDKLEHLNSYEGKIRRELHDITLIIHDSYIFEATNKK